MTEETEDDGTTAVLIYLSGGRDTDMREAAGALLRAGHVDRVQLLEAAPLTLKKDRPKLSPSGRALVMATDRQRLSAAMADLRSSAEPDWWAAAIPALDFF